MDPINSGLRFSLEIVALVARGSWGAGAIDGPGRYVLAAAAPLAAAAAWGIFAVPGDPSRGQDGLVAISGPARLVLELGFFSAASLAIYDADRPGLAIGYAGVVVLHSLWSADRVRWLLAQP